MRIHRGIAMMCVTALLASGCAKDGKQAQGDAQGALTPVHVALDWVPNTNHTGLYVALEKGYYKDAGLDVTIDQPAEGSGLSLVATGAADFVVSFQEEIAYAMTADEPLPVVSVAAIVAHNTSGILSLAAKNIQSPKDMAGHNYATWDTPIEKAILKSVVSKDGGNYDDITMVPSTVTDVVTALSTDIDTVWVYYGWDVVAANKLGLDTNFFYFKDAEVALDFYTPVLASSEAYLAQNPDTAKAFLAATAKGYDYAIANPEDAAVILCTLVPEIDLDLAKASQAYLATQYKDAGTQWGVVDPQRWDRFYTWLYDNKVIAKPIPAGKGFTNDYL